jgi:hypothetical protein
MAIFFYIFIFLIIPIIMTMKQNKNFYFNQNYKPIKRHYPYYNELNAYKNFFKKYQNYRRKIKILSNILISKILIFQKIKENL